MCRFPRVDRRRPARSRRNRGGATLVEAALAIFLVGMVSTAALSAVRGAFHAQQRTVQRMRALQLAEELAAEALLLPYCAVGDKCSKVGPDTGESALNRSTFDDFDDYHGLVESPLRDVSGSLLPGADGWTRRATCDWVSAANWNQSRVADENIKRLIITAEHTDGTRATVTLYRTRAWKPVSSRVTE
jgi:type II secretory pathway pseudopilin PulG